MDTTLVIDCVHKYLEISVDINYHWNSPIYE